MDNTFRGDERYIITNQDKNVATIIHKARVDGKPDLDGLEYHVIDELGDGYMVYMVAADPSQPSPNYFIHKRYILNQVEKQ